MLGVLVWARSRRLKMSGTGVKGHWEGTVERIRMGIWTLMSVFASPGML